jgi:hypothetical protein
MQHVSPVLTASLFLFFLRHLDLALQKQKLDYYWPVGFTNSELLCITCKGGETFPKVT